MSAANRMLLRGSPNASLVRRKIAITNEQIVGAFEGLGDNCELGMVQRICGAEPLGLFRFAGASIHNVIDVISTQGSHLFTTDDLALSFENDEYIFRSKHYDDFLSHTYIHQRFDDEEQFKRKRIQALSYLKDRFFNDMRESAKIYVRKGADSIVDVLKLHEALNRYGRNALLWVVEADRFHPAGTIEKIDRGLWRGYVKRFKRFSKDEPIDLVSWLVILRKAYGVRHSWSRFAQPRCLARGRMRHFDTTLVAESCSQPEDGSGCLSLVQRENTWGHEVIASAEAELVAGSAGVVALAVPIRIDRDHLVERIDVCLLDLPVLHSHYADLHCRGVWQKVWVTADLQPGRAIGRLAVRSRAREGTIISIGDWTIESGPIPASAPSKPSVETLVRLIRERWRRRGKRGRPRATISEVLQASNEALVEGRFIEADDMLAVALAEAPGDAALLKQYALSAHNGARYGAAILRWQRALAAAPHDPMCHAGVAANFRESGELGIAANVIGSALERFPDDGTVLTEAARIAYKRRRFAEQLGLLERAIALFGPFAELLDEREKARAEIAAEARRAAGLE